MLYEPCPICRGSGLSDDPPINGYRADCMICGGKKFIEVGLTRQQFDHKLLIADDAELILRAVATGKCELKRQTYDDDLMIRFHGGGPTREQLIYLPLPKLLRERLIQLVGNE